MFNHDFPLSLILAIFMILFILVLVFLQEKQEEYELKQMVICISLIEKSTKTNNPDILKIIEIAKNSHCSNSNFQ